MESRLRLLLRKREDPYAGADAAAIRRMTGVLWLVTFGIAVVVSPLAPPTGRVGAAGWAAVAVLGAIAGAVGWTQLRSGSRAGHRSTLAKAYLALAMVLAFAWLAGGDHAPYYELFWIWAGFAAVSQPPRKAATFLLAVIGVSSLFVVAEGFSGVAAAQHSVQLTIWTALSLVAIVWMDGVRTQRVATREQGEHAMRLARVDELTGLPNRRAFDEALAIEVARALREERALSIAVFDVDDFKAINDGYGHLSGDRLLRQTGAALRTSTRAADACFRWGGDEFAVLLPGSDAGAAEDAARRTADAVARMCTRPDGRPLGVSCGCAELLPGMTAEDLLAQADLAMFSLKSGGSRDGIAQAGARSGLAT